MDSVKTDTIDALVRSIPPGREVTVTTSHDRAYRLRLFIKECGCIIDSDSDKIHTICEYHLIDDLF
jgi:hypothetical protein